MDFMWKDGKRIISEDKSLVRYIQDYLSHWHPKSEKGNEKIYASLFLCRNQTGLWTKDADFPKGTDAEKPEIVFLSMKIRLWHCHSLILP